MADHTPVKETIDVTITGRSSKAIILRHKSQKRHMACSSDELLEELSAKLPCKRIITVESNIITAYEKYLFLFFPSVEVNSVYSETLY